MRGYWLEMDRRWRDPFKGGWIFSAESRREYSNWAISKPSLK